MMSRIISFLTALLVACAVRAQDSRTVNSVVIRGTFDSYITTTQLDYLLVRTVIPGECRRRSSCVQSVELQAVVCSESDHTGCDLLNAGDSVYVVGKLESVSVCTDGGAAVYYNRVLPLEVWRCAKGGCVNLAP